MDELLVSVVNLKGSSFELGLKQAEEMKRTQLINQLDFLENLAVHSNPKKAKELLKTFSPSILEELAGLAQGLEMDLDTIIRLYSGYDLNFPSMGCTTFVNDDYYVRNYEFSPEIYDARFVFSNPIGSYASVGFSQQVIGRLDGMNEKGLVVGLHFVNDEYKGEGFLATTIVRMLLEQCKCIKEAINLITTIPHKYCYNYSMIDSSGEGVVVEAAPEKQCVVFKKPLICTNYFASNDLREKNKKEFQSSLKREEYIRGQLKEVRSPIAAYHHFNDVHSPLFFKNYQEYFGTLHTVVYSPKDLSLIIGIGENSEPTKLSFKEYLDGTSILPRILKGRMDSEIASNI